jgi:hypothetical protein
MLDVVLFGSLKKNMIPISVRLTRINQPPRAESRSITISSRRWWKSTSGALLHTLGSLMTLTKIRMDGLLFDEEKFRRVPASQSSGSTTQYWRVCRSEGNKQDLDGLTNQNKSISSIYPIFLTSRSKDMRPTI